MSCSGLLPHTRAVLCARQMPCHAMPCQAKPRYGRHFEHLPLALLPLPSLLLFTHSRLCCRPYLPLGKQRHIKWCISTHSSSSPFYPATVRFVPSPPPTDPSHPPLLLAPSLNADIIRHEDFSIPVPKCQAGRLMQDTHLKQAILHSALRPLPSWQYGKALWSVMEHRS